MKKLSSESTPSAPAGIAVNASGVQRDAAASKALDGYRRAAESGLKLDMTRGKPCAEQLDLSTELLHAVGPDDYRSEDGIDCRNYGGVEGLPEARRLFGEYLGVPSDRVLVQDNSSLRLMHDLLVQAMLFGVPGGRGPWSEQPTRFLCPVPGYDRHFAILEQLGIEMIHVALGPDGPDLDQVSELVAGDPGIRGMFCVPKYSNPSGITYSDAVVEGLAAMATAAPDFRVFWDNAYAEHHLVAQPRPLEDFLGACQRAGHDERGLVFGSTSKISFGGAGVSMIAASERNLAEIVRRLSRQTIGPDKLNQLRHVRFFGDVDGIRAHMRLHAEILRPKFDAVAETLDRRLAGLELATWSEPEGGYFVHVEVAGGCARRVVELASAAGLDLTSAGATFPYGNDPNDRSLRLAPSYPPLEELSRAAELVCDCIVIAGLGLEPER